MGVGVGGGGEEKNTLKDMLLHRAIYQVCVWRERGGGLMQQSVEIMWRLGVLYTTPFRPPPY